MIESTNQNLKESHRKLPSVGYCTPVIIPKEELHRTFGGFIYFSDFNTEYSGNENKRSVIADRIMTCKKFDEQCAAGMIQRRWSYNGREKL